MAPQKRLQLSELPLQVAAIALTLAFLIVPAVIVPSARAQTYTVLYHFSGADGEFPQARLILDTKGNGYGTAMTGGASGNGTVFTLSRKRKSIYSFTGSGGSYPLKGLVRDSAGNLYGTTAMGSNGRGTVFKLDANGNETVLHSFSGGTSDGIQPQSALLLDSAGNLYGTTVLGGFYNLGIVFKLDANGIETILHNFAGGPDGEYPYSGLFGDTHGNVYGTTGGDGSSTWGTVFKISGAGSYSVLYDFTGGLDGGQPMAGLTWDNAGNLYGTTKAGGAFGHGSVFELGANGIETALYSFTGGADGSQPQSALLLDSTGDLYGTTVLGGASGFGTIFKLDMGGNETVLHSFTGGSDGQYPYAGLVRDARGNLYGTTSEGGATSDGTIFEITP
jgi:uncharacterized repeat protein (TIGR03803 family)